MKYLSFGRRQLEIIERVILTSFLLSITSKA
jgi:hypothetical protein